jgi:hypothetical protein
VPNLKTKVSVAERHACDRRPVDLRQAAEAMRLLSNCWAEQRERMARLGVASALAQAQPIEVQEQPASRWVGEARPKSGTATIVFHSIVWQYMPPAEQAAIQPRYRLMRHRPRGRRHSFGCERSLMRTRGNSN